MRFRLLLVSLLLVGANIACRGKHNANTVQNEEQAEAGPRIVSAFKMSDPTAPPQLLHGFYGLESGTWRWTAGRFSVLLKTPASAAQRGATLTFAFSAPEVVIQKTGGFTLTAAAGATTLKSQPYTKSGSYTFTADVPPELLVKETITIDFTMDKSMPPGPGDHRELGLIAVSTGLESK
ncbi:MAG: hypothetical protein M3N54_13010 [Acidobacteriota bacterium]|nr:hypothetical protein [Acidobacteriota bacterium]